jgi:RNA polymerase sigma factor (sigma-70 family)
MLEPHVIQELLAQAQKGDRQALEQLLAELRPRLELLASRYVDPANAGDSTADLVQEAALRIWQKLAQFQGGPDDAQTAAMFHKWVSQLVHHVGVDKQRERTAQRRAPAQRPLRLDAAPGADTSSAAGGLDPAAGGPTPSANVGAAEEARLIRDALDKIPDDTDREIVHLCFFQGLSLCQIAEKLNLSYDKVRERYHQCLRFLDRELGELLS